MADFGEELRIERERQGVSFDRLSQETKIQPRHLEALERGAFEELPGGVFRRGIVRAYLVALHLEEDIWMSRFHASVADQAAASGVGGEAREEANQEAWAAFALNVKNSRPAPQRRDGWRWLGVACLAAATAAGFWAVWVYAVREMSGR